MNTQWVKGNTIYDFRLGTKITLVITDKNGDNLDVKYIVDGLYSELLKEKNRNKVGICHELGVIATGPLADEMHVTSFMLGYYFKQLVSVNKLKIKVEGPEVVGIDEFDEVVLDRLDTLEKESVAKIKEQFNIIKKITEVIGIQDEKKS